MVVVGFSAAVPSYIPAVVSVLQVSSATIPNSPAENDFRRLDRQHARRRAVLALVAVLSLGWNSTADKWNLRRTMSNDFGERGFTILQQRLGERVGGRRRYTRDNTDRMQRCRDNTSTAHR